MVAWAASCVHHTYVDLLIKSVVFRGSPMLAAEFGKDPISDIHANGSAPKTGRSFISDIDIAGR